MYLSYADFIEKGGDMPEAAFLQFERVAENTLNYFTQDRIKELDNIPESVKDTVFDFVCELKNTIRPGGQVTSYSNGIESFSFDLSKDPDDVLYNIAVRNLPIELISSVI